MQFQDRITHGLPTSMSNLKHDPSVPVGVSAQSDAYVHKDHLTCKVEAFFLSL